MQAPVRWHILQISDVLDEELASALGQDVEVTGWVPDVTIFSAWIGTGAKAQTESRLTGFRKQIFQVPKGYARLPRRFRAIFDSRLVQVLQEGSTSSGSDVLVCTAPYFAGVAELWPGPVIYWLTDLIAEYESARGIDVPALDRRMCAAATLVCPNSIRIGDYLQHQGCDRRTITIVPNATRGRNLLAEPPVGPSVLEEFRSDGRPIAGVIGNLAGNMDWVFLDAVVTRTPWLKWVFVGPTTMSISDKEQRQRREAVQQAENARFVGKKPYGELAAYARSFHVAVLPYLKCEPTYSGSSTRFYEHLAACRPMIATRGFAEVLQKEPLLRLVDTADEALAVLKDLDEIKFNDGRTLERWLASQQGTWEVRARAMQDALTKALLTI